MPDAAAKAFQELTAEFESGHQIIEAQVARDADKLETLIQAAEYQAQGHDTAAWQEPPSPRCEQKQHASSPRPSPPPTPNGGPLSPRLTASYAPAPRAAPAIFKIRLMRDKFARGYKRLGAA